jgi:hypothetical protein
MADQDVDFLQRGQMPDRRRRRDEDEDEEDRGRKKRKLGLEREARDMVEDLLRQIRQSREALQSARPDLPDDVAIEILKYTYGEARVRQAFGLAPQK